MNITRRNILSGIASVSTAACAGEALAGTASPPAKGPSIDEFLATATSDERARYHANALADLMNEAQPGTFYVARIDWKHRFALIVDQAPERDAS